MHPDSLLVPQQLMAMIGGTWVSQSIHAAATLGIADFLIAGPQSCEKIAPQVPCHGPSLYRLLRGLASVGIFQETAPQVFALTPIAEFLRSDHPQSLRAIAIMMGDPEHYRAWGDLTHSIQTGSPAFDHCFGKDVFAYYQGHPQAADVFEQAMNSFSTNELQAILPAYDFSAYQTLVDVGGGYGELLGSILHKYPQAQGQLFDLAHVVQQAEPTLAKHGVRDRCQTVSGSFFDFVPPGGDAYLLKHIIHDWDDERSITILQNCRAAMADHAKVLIFEFIVPPGNGPSRAKLLDLNMLVMCPGGKERTVAEFETILAQAGLKLSRIVPTQEEIYIIEAIKI